MYQKIIPGVEVHVTEPEVVDPVALGEYLAGLDSRTQGLILYGAAISAGEVYTRARMSFVWEGLSPDERVEVRAWLTNFLSSEHTR